jgi:hypothetical protein
MFDARTPIEDSKEKQQAAVKLAAELTAAISKAIYDLVEKKMSVKGWSREEVFEILMVSLAATSSLLKKGFASSIEKSRKQLVEEKIAGAPSALDCERIVGEIEGLH